MKKNKCGGSDCEKYIREVIVGWYYSFIIHEKLYVNEKKEKCEKKKKKKKYYKWKRKGWEWNVRMKWKEKKEEKV